jgi:uncharacterized membrane protein YhaH (DUF805 family)
MTFIIGCIFVWLLTLSAALALFMIKPDNENRFGSDEIKHTMFVSFLMGLFTFLSSIAVMASMKGMGLFSLAILPVMVATVGFGAKIFYGMDFLSGFYFALIIFGIFSLLLKFGPYLGLGLPVSIF